MRPGIEHFTHKANELVCAQNLLYFLVISQRDSVYEQIRQDCKTRIARVVLLCTRISTQLFLHPYIMFYIAIEWEAFTLFFILLGV